MSEVETAWVAGLLEGEGCFTFGPWSNRKRVAPTRNIRVQCSMTDLDTIEKLHQLTGIGNVQPESRKDKRRPHAKPLYIWSAAKREDVIDLLVKIRPHMGERRGARIDELLKYAEENPPIYNQPVVHGTRRSYRKGCRCDECRAEVARYARESRARKKVSV